VARVDEHALELELDDGALDLPQVGRPAARQDGGERVERALVGVLDLGRVVGPALDRRELVLVVLAAQIVRGVAHHADGDAGSVVSVEHVLHGHRATPAPGRPALAVPGRVVGRLLGRIDMGVPLDDHAMLSLGAF
jgi:hypothetical protein